MTGIGRALYSNEACATCGVPVDLPRPAYGVAWWTKEARPAMTRMVWEAQLFPGQFDLHVPKGSRLLGLGLSAAGLVAWFLTEPGAMYDLETRRYMLAGSGEWFDADGWHHVASVAAPNPSGQAGIHLFARDEEATSGRA